MNALAHRISRMGEAVFNRFRGSVLCPCALLSAVGACLGIVFSGVFAFAQTNPSDVFSVAEEELAAWENTLDEYSAGTLNPRVPHTVLNFTPAVIERLLEKDGRRQGLRVIINKSILDKTVGKTPSKFTGDFHKIALADLTQLPAQLVAPIAIFDSAHGNGDKVVLTEMKDSETGESVIVALAIEAKRGNEHVHAISSIHGRGLGSFHKWLKDGRLRYYHTKKFPQWLVSVGVQNPRASIPRGNEILTEKDFRKSALSTKKTQGEKMK